MTILVIDVAAEHSGAVTVLNQFISEFKKDPLNNYIVVLSVLKYFDYENVKFVNYDWVKKSHLHRLYFDNFVVPKLVKKLKPNKVFSLQNNAFRIDNIPQEVYFHNALPISEKKFSFFESKSLWIYQNIIGFIVRKSLKYADSIKVQAEWVKEALIKEWNVNRKKIEVKRIKIEYSETRKEYNPKALFYPANGGLYKNHFILLKALIPLWNKYGAPELRLTGTITDLPKNCQRLLLQKNYPVHFLGRLTKDEMNEQYRTAILVFPSCIETVGLPLIEAKMNGALIIASDYQYAKEALGNYENASYFKPSDIENLTGLIEKQCRLVKII